MSSKKIISWVTIFCILCSFVYASDVDDSSTELQNLRIKIDSIQDPLSGLPSGVSEPKGKIGYIISKMFNSDGRISNSVLKSFNGPTRVNNNLLKWSGGNGGNFVNSIIYDTGTNVGIGTSTPTQKLDVAGNINFSWDIYKNGVQVDFAWKFVDGTNPNDAVYTTGNVGVGTNNPGMTFEVSTNHWTGHAFRIRHQGSGAPFTDFIKRPSTYTSPNALSIYNHDGTLWRHGITIDNIGNVGIGTESPSHKLDVYGDIWTIGQNVYFGTEEQKIYGGGSFFLMDSDHDTHSILTLRDKQDENLVSLYGHKGTGPGDNGHFGLMDADQNWAFLNHTDNYSQIRINDIGQMHINTDNTFLRGQQLQVGWNRTGNRYAYMDLVGDDTYTDYGLRVMRGNGGANSWSQINHKGAGTFYVGTEDAADFILRTNWVDRLTVKANTGHVGIGTTSPQARLHVNDTSDLSLTSTGHGLTVGSHTGYNVGIDGNEIMARNNGLGATLFIQNDVGSSNTVLNRTSGNVGIGTSSPAHKLDVNGIIWMSWKQVIYGNANDVYVNARVLQNTSTTLTDGMFINYNSTNSSNNTVKFYTAGTAERMRIANNGNVGIGTADVNNKLTITWIGDIWAANSGGGVLIEDSSGNASGFKFRIDANEAQASYNGVAHNYHFNTFGGGVRLNSTAEGMFEVGQNNVSGSYGTVTTDGYGKGWWEWYSVNGRAVFMHDGWSATWIYNDVDNEWMFLWYRNSDTRMYHNWGIRIQTHNNWVRLHGGTQIDNVTCVGNCF